MPLFGRTARPASQGHSRTFLSLLGAAGLLVAALLAYVGLNAPNAIPGRSTYDLKAQFREADNLTSHYQVRVAGRLVGQVLHPEVHNGMATVELQLDKDLKPLKSDTILRVRPRSPIGVRFVELIPGTSGRPLKTGETIPARQTSSALPLDTVLGTLDAPTRRRTKQLLRALGGGFAARGEDLNAAIDEAPGALHSAAGLAGAITGRTGAVHDLVTGADAAADAADPVRDTIARGFRPERDALKPLADVRSSVARTLEVAPRDLEGARAGLARTSPFLRELGGLARDARPLLAAAPSSLPRAAALLREGRPAISRLDRTLTLAQRAVDPTLGLLRTADPALPTIDETTRSGLPLVAQLAPRGCDLVFMLRNFESILAWGDQTGNFLRFIVIGSPESVGGQESRGILAPVPQGNPYPAPCAVRNDRLTTGAAR